MKNVKRYTPYRKPACGLCVAEMKECETGGYIAYNDYIAQELKHREEVISSMELINTTQDQSQADCPHCELLRMEVKRLKWLIQNMMTDINEIEEF